jgi:hypothetical protein
VLVVDVGPASAVVGPTPAVVGVDPLTGLDADAVGSPGTLVLEAPADRVVQENVPETGWPSAEVTRQVTV